jgi:drug/metabolite transporter (DMT)-like permease
MLEPILNPVWVVIWYDEVPAKWSLAGGGIIIIALMIRMIYLKQIQLKEKKALT